MKMRVIVAAGGTGGHIVPAIAFGEWMKNKYDNCSLDYVCGIRSVETEIYNSFHIRPFRFPLEGSPLGRKDLFSFCSRSTAIVKSLLQACRLIKEVRPDLCLLFGGYVSFPVLGAASLYGIPVLVHEQNARSGRITKLASALGKQVLSGWKKCDPLSEDRFKTVGVPVRKISRLQLSEAWNILDIGCNLPKGPIVVVMGGSLGSNSIYDIICNLAVKNVMKGVTFLLIGGNSFIENSPENVIPIGKYWDLSALISVASVAIVRGGASTLSEMAVYKMPSIVIPWKESAANHQLLNATCFTRDNGGFIWHESDALDALAQNIVDLIGLRNPLSDVEIETSRISINEKICEEIFVALGREIL